MLFTEKIKYSAPSRKTLSFYCYRFIENPSTVRDELYEELKQLDVRGRIYVASEGINAQISIPVESMMNLKTYLQQVPYLSNIEINTAVDHHTNAFVKLKVLVRKKIVADGLADQALKVSGTDFRLDAVSFNQLTDHPDTIIVDVRNHYENEIGHFKNAICTDADTFRDAIPLVVKVLKKKKDQNIILYCTGGIRCEKATAWLRHLGFKNVFQLDGGITKYAKQVTEQGLENKFIGKNFVFDSRLGERISHDVISTCHQCGTPCDTHTNCDYSGCHLLFIQCEKCAERFHGCCSEECSQIIALPEGQQKILRRGLNNGRKIFKKGRWPKAAPAVCALEKP